jgi:hypothetical protein
MDEVRGARGSGQEGAHGRAVLAVGTCVLTAVFLGLALLLGHSNTDGLTGSGLLAALTTVALFTAVGSVGLLLALRRAENPIGWILLGVAFALALLLAAQEYATYGLTVADRTPSGALAAAWLATWLWYPAIGMLLLFVPLLFPTGRPPSRRWHLVGWTGLVGLVLATGHAALSETLGGEELGYEIANPIGIRGVVAEEGPLDAVAFALVSAAILAATVSVVVRFRRAKGVERQQLKWMLSAVALLTINMVSDLVPGGLPDVVNAIVFPASVAALPLAIGVAIMRYRLYEIDRIVSRTVAYAVITGVLVTVYAGSVMLLGRVLAPVTQQSELTVAASTLMAAALFQPVRRRVQAAVDRRFNRARYDAQRTVEAFAARLRDEVDLEGLSEELAGVVQGTVAPATVSLWVREGTA